MAEAARYGWHRRLKERFGVGGDALYILITGAVAILISGLVAHVLREPLLFPSLGPTVFLVFEKPLAPESSPRNTLIGHCVGIAVGSGAIVLFGLRGARNILEGGATPARIGAATFSVAVTGALLLLFDAAHPPAGASTLIVSLGLLATPRTVLAMAAGVVLLTVAAWLINRVLGVPVHVWRADAPPPSVPAARRVQRR
jgi:hypothetical protein